jgi:hypothetical protein
MIRPCPRRSDHIAVSYDLMIMKIGAGEIAE